MAALDAPHGCCIGAEHDKSDNQEQQTSATFWVQAQEHKVDDFTLSDAHMQKYTCKICVQGHMNNWQEETLNSSVTGQSSRQQATNRHKMPKNFASL